MNLAYVPDSTVERVDYEGPPSAERVQCATCGKVFCGGAVVNDPLEAEKWFKEIEEFRTNLEHALRRFDRDAFAVRVLHCDDCEHLQVWTQIVNFPWASIVLMRPMPDYGDVITQPCIIRNEPRKPWVDRFLANHPEAKGVMQR